MKVLFNAFAVLALIAATAYSQDEPTEPLDCEVTEPKPFEVWQCGEVASTAWECDTPNNRPLERMGPLYLYHIELGTGDDKDFTYVDTLDASAKIRDLRFDWILKEYPPRDDYVVRMFSKLKSTEFPETQNESDELDWTYIYPISIVAAGDEEGLERANERREEEGGAKGNSGDRKDAKNNDETDDSSAKDDDKTDDSETDGNGADGSGASGSDATGGDAAGGDAAGNGTEGSGAAGNGTDTLGNSATSLLVGNSVLFAASAIAGVLVL